MLFFKMPLRGEPGRGVAMTLRLLCIGDGRGLAHEESGTDSFILERLGLWLLCSLISKGKFATATSDDVSVIADLACRMAVETLVRHEKHDFKTILRS